MIQDIGAHKFQNEYREQVPRENDYVIWFQENHLVMNGKNEVSFYTYGEMRKKGMLNGKEIEYLFKMDGTACFLVYDMGTEGMEEKRLVTMNELRGFQPRWMAFAGLTAHQIERFRRNNRFCGRCGGGMEKSKTERACVCTQCKNIIYPKISPAVIVGIIDGDRILMTNYAGRAYTKYALIAGFMEVGETLEETVRREVREEVGLEVKEITYYKNQPWAFSDSLLVGFFATLDGSSKVTLDETELSEAVWFQRDEIPREDTTNASLTHEMIEVFRKNKVYEKQFLG